MPWVEAEAKANFNSKFSTQMKKRNDSIWHYNFTTIITESEMNNSSAQ